MSIDKRGVPVQASTDIVRALDFIFGGDDVMPEHKNVCWKMHLGAVCAVLPVRDSHNTTLSRGEKEDMVAVVHLMKMEGLVTSIEEISFKKQMNEEVGLLVLIPEAVIHAAKAVQLAAQRKRLTRASQTMQEVLEAYGVAQEDIIDCGVVGLCLESPSFILSATVMNQPKESLVRLQDVLKAAGLRPECLHAGEITILQLRDAAENMQIDSACERAVKILSADQERRYYQ